MTVLFDLGGVLVDLDPSWPARVGLDPAEVSGWLARSEAFASFERGELSDHAFLGDLGRAFGVDPERLGPAFDAWVCGPSPGALALLDAVRGPRGLLSNTNVRHWARFDPDRRLRDRAGTALPSHLIGARKPDAAAWERAEALLGGPPAVFLDDSEGNVASARAWGWDAVRVDGPAGARVELARRSLLVG